MTTPEIKIIHGTSIEVLKGYPDNSVDAIVTDPPYGLGKEPDIMEVMKDWIEKGYHEIKGKSGGFMGKQWDSFVPQPIEWKEVFRVLKPGGHALVACGTRTQDWMVASLRFAGFQIRDVITWHFGQGFPKSLDISKALDKYFGAERETTGVSSKTGKRKNSVIDDKKGKENRTFSNPDEVINYTSIPATEQAKQWAGFGTALKPATEFWTLCRKPISEKTVSQNILKWGVGAINIDGSRIGDNAGWSYPNGAGGIYSKEYQKNNKIANDWNKFSTTEDNKSIESNAGRFPSNVIFDEFTAELLDNQTGELTSGVMKAGQQRTQDGGYHGGFPATATATATYGDSGGASRFYYVAKASRSERNKGLENLGIKKEHNHSRFDTCSICNKYIFQNATRESHCSCENPKRTNLIVHGNHHPTVKPVSLMRYLVRLITPQGGTVLDPYNGSGTTGIACKMEGFNYIGIEREADYVEISNYRIAAWEQEPPEGKQKPKEAEYNPNQITMDLFGEKK